LRTELLRCRGQRTATFFLFGKLLLALAFFPLVATEIYYVYDSVVLKVLQIIGFGAHVELDGLAFRLDHVGICGVLDHALFAVVAVRTLLPRKLYLGTSALLSCVADACRGLESVSLVAVYVGICPVVSKACLGEHLAHA